MTKPLEILELEKELGFELAKIQAVYISFSEREVPIPIWGWQSQKKYNIDKNTKVIWINLAGCELKYISLISKLEKLKLLDLNNNMVENINPILSLKNLIAVDLSINMIQEITLSFLQNLPRLSSIKLYGNPIKNIPKEIFDHRYNVLSQLRDFLQDLERGASANNEVKLLLLGNGGVGKTQIARRLAEQERFVFNAQHDSTHGIVLLQRELENLNLNIWDFAGQDIYHATHRLFMQTRALFVLVWDLASETSSHHEHEGRRYKNEKLQYWLEYARCFAPESPILVVQNKVDTPDESEQTYLEQTLEYYKTQYPIIEFVQVSAQTGYNFDVLEYWLAESFQQDENLKQQLLIDIPSSWAQVRARIRAKQAEQKKTLSVEDFKTLCAAVGIPDSWHTLLQYLHDTSVLYYHQGYFDNQIILDQAWAIDAVYAVLNRQSFYFRTGKIKKGRLQYSDLQSLWKDNTDDERKLFIDFMLSTELCFETTENKSYDTPLQERTFVVPQLLPEDKPKAVDFEEQERNIRQINEVVSYRFLPSVFIQRFIIKANRFSKVEMMWQHGILLQWQKNHAVLEANYDTKQILIHATNAFLMQKIKEELEIITKEGKIRAAKFTDSEDPVERGERFLYGLAGLTKRRIFDTKTTSQMSRSTIQQLIAKGRLAEALEAIAKVLPTSQQNEIIQLQSQLSDLEREVRLGIINHSDAGIKRARINYAALELIGEEAEDIITQSHFGNGDNVGGNKIVYTSTPPQRNPIEQQIVETPEKFAKYILFAAANPSNETRIETDVEHRTIKEEMQKGNNRADFQFLPTQLAVRITELMRAFKAKPTIVHFAGHGIQQGIIVSTDSNESLPLNDATIQRLFKPLQGKTELVLLNSCYSAYQAELISKFGIIVIGHNLPIGDVAAVSFAKGFYLGLSEGMTYEEAYNDGLTAVLAENPNFDADMIEVWKDGNKLKW